MLLIGARLVSGGVHERDDRQVERVAQTHEPRHLFGGVHVEDAGANIRLVGDHADRPAVDAGESDDGGRGEQLVHLHEFAVVDDAADHVEHVIRLAVVVRHDVGKAFRGLAVRASRRIGVHRRLGVAVRRQVGKHRARVVDRVGLVLAEVVRHAGFRAVHESAAEVVHADRLTGGRLDDVRAGDEHVGVLLGHDDQVGQRRAVHGAAGARTQNQRDLRDEAAGVAGLAEDVAVLRQRGDAFLDAGAAGVDDRDDRHLQVQRHVHQVANLLTFGTTQRASPDGEVLRVDGDLAAVHVTESGDDGRTGLAAVDA